MALCKPQERKKKNHCYRVIHCSSEMNSHLVTWTSLLKSSQNIYLKTLWVQILVQMHIYNEVTNCFLSERENNFHDFHMTVQEKFSTRSDLYHKALPYAGWYFLISLFLCIVLYAWQTSNQMKKKKKIAFDPIFRLTASSFVFI